MKILYIGNKIFSPQSGAEVVNRRNQILLTKIVNEENITYIPLAKGGFSSKFGLGINRDTLASIDIELSRNDYTHVFVSQSLLGKAVGHIRKKYPAMRIISFMHNVEIDYAREYLKTAGILHLPFYVAVKYLEAQTIKYSTEIVTLNTRDSGRLQEMYHRATALELPTTFDDRYTKSVIPFSDYPIDYLFVGVAFFANIEGVQWFISNVLPHVSGHLMIIGKGMDRVNFKSLSEKVHIKGFVADLKPYYAAARMVVSPIFSGAGMKTKTAEALMFGKTIIGTKEAFEGYLINPECMKECNTPQEFIDAINVEQESNSFFNLASRRHFLKHYITDVLIEPLSNLLKSNL